MTINEKQVKLKELQKEVDRRNKLRCKINKDLNLIFKIPDYIIEDIIDEEYFYHICLIINMAVLNNRITKKNGEVLKNRIKKIYNIQNIYDCVKFN